MYQVPPFFKDYIVSNDMIHILVKLLHNQAECRFDNIYEVKKALESLRDNIKGTP